MIYNLLFFSRRRRKIARTCCFAGRVASSGEIASEHLSISILLDLAASRKAAVAVAALPAVRRQAATATDSKQGGRVPFAPGRRILDAQVRFFLLGCDAQPSFFDWVATLNPVFLTGLRRFFSRRKNARTFCRSASEGVSSDESTKSRARASSRSSSFCPMDRGNVIAGDPLLVSVVA